MLACERLIEVNNLLVKQELQELHSALEEAKADIVGLWALKFFINQVSDHKFHIAIFEACKAFW